MNTNYSASNTVQAAAGINHQINFQGKLVNPNGTNVTDGTYSVVFSIYNVSTGGTAIWTETQTVTVTTGVFQVNLGSVTTLPGSVDFNSDSIYLGVKVGSDAEMLPRITFTAVPQAFNSEKLGGLDKSGFIQNTTTQQASTNFNIGGNGTATSFTTSTLQSASSTALNITANAASTWSTSAGNLSIQAAGTSTLGLDTGGAGTIALGTNATIVGVANASAASTLSMATGNGGNTVNLLTGTGTNTLTVGNASGSTSSQFYGSTTYTLQAGKQLAVTTGSTVPTVDQLGITNAGSTGVTTANVNGLSINYKGGAAAVESAAQRIDLQPGTTSGGTWSGLRFVAGATGPASGVTENGIKLQGPTVGGAGTYNGITVANIGAVALNGTANGLDISSANAQSAGTINGININTLTPGAATENAINIGGGWDTILQSPNFTVTGAGAVTATSTIQGTSVNGTTGINTGAAGGTQRIDASGNLLNLGYGSFTGIAAPAVSAASAGRIYYDSSSNTFKVSLNGAAYNNLLTGLTGFAQNGNSFGTTATLGTTDANSLTIGTYNGTALQQRIGITNTTASGNNATLTLTGLTVIKPTANAYGTLQVQNASGAPILSVDTSNYLVSIFGGISNAGSGGSNSEEYGYLANASGASSTAIGNSATSSGDSSIALGFNSTASGSSNIAIGNGVTVQNSSNVGIGIGSNVGTGTNGASVAIGAYSQATGDYSTALGEATSVTGNYSNALGSSTNVGGVSSIAIGNAITLNYNNSIAIGNNAAATATNQFVAGSDGTSINDAYFGNGVTNATGATSFTLHATGGSGTNKAGGALNLAGGMGTGTGAGGGINLQIAKPGTTGTAQNTTLSSVLALNGTTGAAIFKNATNGASGFEVQASGGGALFSINTNLSRTVISGTAAGYSTTNNATLYVGRDSTTSRSINAGGTINASGADYAEYIPWNTTKPSQGSIVNYNGSNYIVSSQTTAAFVGNDNFDEDHSILVTFTGQVPVRVTGAVHTGDLLIPNGDGTAKPVAPSSATIGQILSKVAIAQEDNTDPAVKLVKASVGTTSDSMATALQNQSATFADITALGTANFGSLNVSGSTTLKDLTVTGNASVQGTLTVNTISVGTLQISGHLVTKGDAPNLSANPALGTGGVITVDGNDTAGTLTLKTGSANIATGDLGKLLFKNGFGKAPRIILSAQDADSQMAQIFPSNKTANDFTIKASQTLPANKTYTFDYIIVE